MLTSRRTGCRVCVCVGGEGGGASDKSSSQTGRSEAGAVVRRCCALTAQRPSNMLVYHRDVSTYIVILAATLRDTSCRSNLLSHPVSVDFSLPHHPPASLVVGRSPPERHTWGRYPGGRRPSSDDSFHSLTVIPPSALDKPSIIVSGRAVTPHLVVRRRW